jgi:hypothetical protein
MVAVGKDGNNQLILISYAVVEAETKWFWFLEGLKNYISTRIVTQRKMMQKYTWNICPKIQELLEKAKRAADGLNIHCAGDIEYGLF